MSHKGFTTNKRNNIDLLSKEVYSYRRISKIVFFRNSSIFWELTRFSN